MRRPSASGSSPPRRESWRPGGYRACGGSRRTSRRGGVRRSTGISRAAKRSRGAAGSARRQVATAGRRLIRRAGRAGTPAGGQLGRERPLALEVTHVLDEVPPHLIADQLVAEARRAAGVPVALYVVDIDGSHLLRLSGSAEFPERLDAPPAVGPEIVPEGLGWLYEQPSSGACPAASRRRCGCAAASSASCCRSARRRRRSRTSPSRAPPRSSWPTTTPTSSRPPAGASRPRAAAEIQQNLFPPRLSPHRRRRARRRPAAHLRGRRRLVRLRREPRRGVAGDRRRRRHRADRRPASARWRSAHCEPRAGATSRSSRPCARCTRSSAGRQPRVLRHRVDRPLAGRRRRSAGSTAATRTPMSSTSRARSRPLKVPYIPRSATPTRTSTPRPPIRASPAESG